MIRHPAVAGQFYTESAMVLSRELGKLIPDCAHPQKAIGIISPHAGYMYSGAVAGKVFGSIEIPSSVLIIGPNHHGRGVPAALYPEGEWLTPLGPIQINNRLNDLILKHVPIAKNDSIAHQLEHSLEVQVPFIQYLNHEATIVALCLGYGDYDAIYRIGKGIAETIRAFGEEVLIVASSDMTHYESADSARRKDERALQYVLSLDPEGLLNICRSERITMCGVVPTAVMLVAAKELGATYSELVAYATSGDVTGDNRQVVGYAAVIVR